MRVWRSKRWRVPQHRGEQRAGGRRSKQSDNASLTRLQVGKEGVITVQDGKTLENELEVLRREHRDLDEAISALVNAAHPDQLRLVRLKKQKLALKDQIARIEDRLTPDIIA